MARIVETVNDTIRSHNDLAKERVLKLWHNPTKLRGLCEKPGSRNEKLTEFKSTVGGVEGDVTDDVTQVRASRE
jgi:hypothetical protein